MRFSSLVAGAFATLLFTAPVSFANDPVAERETRMKALGETNRNLDMMIEGDIDFDLSKLQADVADMQTAMNGMLDLFPAGTGGGETAAKEKIWDNWQDFAEKNQANIDALVKLAEAANSGDEDDIEDAYEVVDKTCRSCHRRYRSKNW
jgi:cytochrome c556